MKKDNKNLTETKETSSKPKETETFATEVLRTFISHSRFVIRGLIIGWATSVIIWVSAGIAFYVWNEQKWEDFFNSYDYILQDGEQSSIANKDLE